MNGKGWPRVAVMGAGAVGCYFGGMLARAGAPVTLIGRSAHVEAMQRDGLFMDSIHFQEAVRVDASIHASAARGAEIVLFCVKTLDTEDAAKSVAPHLSRGVVLLSLQNGVDNVERIRAAAGIDALPAVVYVGAAMSAPGRVRHSARGELIIGHPADGAARASAADLGQIVALFARAGIPCRISERIETELWTKMILNCAYNALSALCRSSYGRALRNPWTHDLIEAVTREAVTVARAADIRIQDRDMIAEALKLGAGMENVVSSTAQDIARGKRTEIDSLNGYVVRRGAALGVPAPVNQTLHALVKLLEESA